MIKKENTQFQDEIARDNMFLQYEAQLRNKIYSLAHQIRKLDWKYKYNEKQASNDNCVILDQSTSNDTVGNLLQNDNNEGWETVNMKDEPPRVWNTRSQTYKWKGPTHGVLLLYEYWNHREIKYDSARNTTTLEVMLDIFLTTGFNGSVNSTSENWKLSELHTNFIYNLKQFFKLVLKPNNPIILKRGHTLTKYNVGTTCMTLPFQVRLQNTSEVVELLQACSIGNNHINKWYVRNAIGPNSWPNLDTFDHNSFSNIARKLYGLKVDTRAATTDEVRKRTCLEHNQQFGQNPKRHNVSLDFIMPNHDPPKTTTFPQWWYMNAKAKCAKCGSITEFKFLNQWLQNECNKIN